MLNLKKLNLQLFADDRVMNTTESSGLTGEQKTFFNTRLIDLVKPYLVHDKFAKKIKATHSKRLEFRRFFSLPKALGKLIEGITPKGNSLKMGTKECRNHQYGDYVTLTDLAENTSIDKLNVEAQDVLSDQAGRTLDTVTREEINGGTNVLYSQRKDGLQVQSRYELDKTAKITVQDVKKAVRILKNNHAPKINGAYAGIINTDVAFDLTNDPQWRNPHEYKDTKELYEGEIGMIEGVRFVENSEAKIFKAPNLTKATPNLTVKSRADKVITVNEVVTDKDSDALVGRKILIQDIQYTIEEATAGTGTATITVDVLPTGSLPTANDKIFGGESGKDGIAVYSTMILGKDAYGVTEIEGLGLQNIVKPLGAGEDALNQRGTSGWKASRGVVRLVEEFMVRIESASTFSDEVDAN